MLYTIRRLDGSADPWSSGTVVTPPAVTRLRAGDYRLVPGRRWTSPDSGGSYPVAWRIAVPSVGIELQAEAAVDAQELRTGRSTGVTYWEGTIDVRGTRDGTPRHRARLPGADRLRRTSPEPRPAVACRTFALTLGPSGSRIRSLRRTASTNVRTGPRSPRASTTRSKSSVAYSCTTTLRNPGRRSRCSRTSSLDEIHLSEVPDRLGVVVEREALTGRELAGHVDHELTDREQREEHVVVEREIAAQSRRGDPRAQLLEMAEVLPEIREPLDQERHPPRASSVLRR